MSYYVTKLGGGGFRAGSVSPILTQTFNRQVSVRFYPYFVHNGNRAQLLRMESGLIYFGTVLRTEVVHLASEMPSLVTTNHPTQ